MKEKVHSFLGRKKCFKGKSYIVTTPQKKDSNGDNSFHMHCGLDFSIVAQGVDIQ